MSFIIKGTVGCRHTEHEGWEAYFPVEMNRTEYEITLAEKEKAFPRAGRFNLVDKEGAVVAGCDFPEGHRYMFVYQELVKALRHAVETRKALESSKLDVPLVITKNGFIPLRDAGCNTSCPADANP